MGRRLSEYKLQKYDFRLKRDGGYTVEETITSKYDVSAFAAKYLREVMPLEHVAVIALDCGAKIIGFQATQGSTNQCAIYPANVFRFLLLSGASSFIMAHNHPGGVETPSSADWAVTKKLQSAGKTLDIAFFDHLIITDEKIISLRENPMW